MSLPAICLWLCSEDFSTGWHEFNLCITHANYWGGLPFYWRGSALIGGGLPLLLQVIRQQEARDSIMQNQQALRQVHMHMCCVTPGRCVQLCKFRLDGGLRPCGILLKPASHTVPACRRPCSSSRRLLPPSSHRRLSSGSRQPSSSPRRCRISSVRRPRRRCSLAPSRRRRRLCPCWCSSPLRTTLWQKCQRRRPSRRPRNGSYHQKPRKWQRKHLVRVSRPHPPRSSQADISRHKTGSSTRRRRHPTRH
jgi:hypothetical protein